MVEIEVGYGDPFWGLTFMTFVKSAVCALFFALEFLLHEVAPAVRDSALVDGYLIANVVTAGLAGFILAQTEIKAHARSSSAKAAMAARFLTCWMLIDLVLVHSMLLVDFIEEAPLGKHDSKTIFARKVVLLCACFSWLSLFGLTVCWVAYLKTFPRGWERGFV
jgi:hypothetical protein